MQRCWQPGCAHFCCCAVGLLDAVAACLDQPKPDDEERSEFHNPLVRESAELQSARKIVEQVIAVEIASPFGGERLTLAVVIAAIGETTDKCAVGNVKPKEAPCGLQIIRRCVDEIGTEEFALGLQFLLNP